MRRKCVSCGLICFISDESCKRCGSNNLVPFSYPNEQLVEAEQNPFKPLSVRNYLTYFLIALVIEIAALFPILSDLGMRHTSRAVSNSEFYSLIIIFILHLPSILITMGLNQIGGGDWLLFTPILQIAFWIFLFVYFGRRKRIKSK